MKIVIRCLFLTVLLFLLMLDVDSGTIKCTLTSFKTNDGRGGRACLMWDENQKNGTNQGNNNSRPNQSTFQLINTPTKCPDGQAFDSNGVCVDVFN